MNTKSYVEKLLFVLMLIFALGSTSCASEAASYPQAWIDYPGDGATVSPGAPVTVISHVFAREGVAEVVLSVNGEAYRRDVPAETGTDFVSMQQGWTPSEAGAYTLQVQGYDLHGQAGNLASVTIEVAGEPVVVSPIAVITASPVITDTPTPVITVTALPPESVVQFYAYPPEISAGSCATIYWNVENAQRVIFGGVGQPFSGSYEACLCDDERYTLTVVHLDGTEERRRLDINVTGSCVTAPPPRPAEDTTPPPVPSPTSPANGAVLSCSANQTLAWSAVSDESGITGYFVKLEIEVKAGQWQSAGGQQVSGTQANFPVNCGGRYRWMVRAQDGAGNFSNWSAPSQFGINLE